MKTALISVFNKTGITNFARSLIEHGYDLIASGGTYKILKEAGLPATNTADLVGEAILGHKVVTLSRELHAGLLADLDTELEKLKELGILPIHLVCVDTYPLKEAVAHPDATLESVREKTDIGGPAMLRSGAKGDRIVICEFEDRQRVIDWLDTGCPDSDAFINELAAKAEGYVADYCLTSAMSRSGGEIWGVVGKKVTDCKYGENGYQTPAALFAVSHPDSYDPLALDQFELVGGTTVSYNNWCDVDRLLQTSTHIAAAFELNYQTTPLIAIGAKHGNCCGSAVGEEPIEVLQNMLIGDPRAIFGGLVMVNFRVGAKEAEALMHYRTEKRRILDGVIAPSFSDEAIEILNRKGGKCRMLSNKALLKIGQDSLDHQPRFRYVRGGLLIQPNYVFVLNLQDPNLWKSSKLSKITECDLLLAWAIGSTSNSNTITLVCNGMLIGNGVGQQDRVGGSMLAINRALQAGHTPQGAVAYSDSFFPFTDGPQALSEAGISAIFATSGSRNDNKVKEFCASAGVTLYLIPDATARGFYGH